MELTTEDLQLIKITLENNIEEMRQYTNSDKHPKSVYYALCDRIDQTNFLHTKIRDELINRAED